MDHIRPSREPEGAEAMARTLESILASRPAVDRAKFDAMTEDDIRRHTIEDGEDPDSELGPARRVLHPAGLRTRLGLSAADFALALDVPVGTVEAWERGVVLPDAAAQSLLAAVSRDPETVFRLIAGRDAA